MNIFRGLGSSDIATPTVVTLGVFDGLHLGHQEIIKTVAARAKELSAVPTVITFEPHPRAVLHPETTPPLLQTLDQKLEGMKYLGIDQVIILHFDMQLAAVTGEDFIRNIIHNRLRAYEVYLGRGFAFGHNRGGNIQLLKQLGSELGFIAGEVPEIRLHSLRISSTVIRKSLKSGRVNLPRKLLGRPYGIEGSVVEGYQKGREMSFPTANLQVENATIPADGVYITLTLVDGAWHRSLTNIGVRPTFGGDSDRSIETFLIDFKGDLYGKTLRLRFLHRLRAEMKFPDMKALQEQIAYDFKRANRYFASPIVQKNLEFR
ncbi:MAG TPA: bifunctional riboflavin kinase/FAD synthetase [Blastocatellia bacterium]|nr:bifunctional riboflavin kinase/FAD synthetase [Blastocatellia bacterium]